MMILDAGQGIRATIQQIARRPKCRATLYVLAPFIETETALWKATVAVLRSGFRVLLFTRPDANRDSRRAIDGFTREGGRTFFVRNLHAKAFLWLPNSPKERAAFIGSHNFTRASETSAIELGVLIWGDGSTEAKIYSSLRTVISGLVHSGQSLRV